MDLEKLVSSYGPRESRDYKNIMGSILQFGLDLLAENRVWYRYEALIIVLSVNSN